MSQIKVLHLRDTYEVGGPGKTILETHRTIDRSRFSLHLGVFLTDSESADSPFIRAAHSVDLPVHEIRSAHQYDPRLVWRVAELAGRIGVHVIHAHEVKSDVIGRLAALLHRGPCITTAHGWIANDAKGRLLVNVDKRALRYYDRVIAVSSSIRSALLDAGVPRDRIRLLHNAIVLDKYQNVERSDALARAMGREAIGPVVIAVGRLSAEKGHADLIHAAAAVASTGRAFELVLAGDGPERAALSALVSQAGLGERVHFLGYVSAPERLIKNADLMVLPSHTEGLPNVILESLTLGVPVLATAVGGTPDVLCDGETGRLVPARSPAAIAAGIGEFLDNPAAWRRMAARGAAVVAQEFGFDQRTRRLEQIYLELVESRGSSFYGVTGRGDVGAI